MNLHILPTPIDSQSMKNIQAWVKAQEHERKISIETPMNLAAFAQSKQGGVAVLLVTQSEQIIACATVVDFTSTKDFEIGISSEETVDLSIFLQEIDAYLTNLGAKSITFVVDEKADREIKGLEQCGVEWKFSEAQLIYKNLNNIHEARSIELIPYQESLHKSYLAVIMEAFGDDVQSAEGLLQLSMEDHERTWYGIHSGENLVGTVNLIRSDEAMITALAIHPQFQGKGLGKAGLIQAVEILMQDGYQTVMIDVEIENEKALSLYKQVGFEVRNQYRFYEFPTKKAAD